MKRLVTILVVFTLLLSCVAAWADTSTGYSNTFTIDNNAGAPPPVDSIAMSTHSTSNGNLLRGQIHAHFINDGMGILYPDPHQSPLIVGVNYHDLGYQFVGITEHDYIATPPPASWQSTFATLVPRGCEEISTGYNFASQCWDWNKQYCHVIALGMEANGPGQSIPVQFPGYEDNNGEKEIAYGPTNTLNSRKQILSDIRSRNGLAIIPHPNTINLIGRIEHPLAYAGNIGGSNFSFDQLCTLAGAYDGISIFNAAIPDHFGLSDARGTWERLLDSGHRVWGYAEDDSTPGPAPTAGRTWVAVPNPPSGSFDWPYIKSQLQNGNFYTYWVDGTSWPQGKIPPQMSVEVTTGQGGLPNKIGVTVAGIESAPPHTTAWLSFIGKKHWEGIFRTRKYATYIPNGGYQYTYECTGREGFIRIEAELPYSFGILHICSQPIMVNKTGNLYQTQATHHVMETSTSSELHLRYLGIDEKPMSGPSAGYIGDAYDVTTDSGQVTPGTTLNLSYDGEDVSPLGGTKYLAIYHYDDTSAAWIKVGGVVDPGTATIESPIMALGKYCISADLPADTGAPEVVIANVSEGTTLSSDLTINASVSDDIGVWRVKYYVNDNLIAEDTDSFDLWTADLIVSNYCAGDWVLKAVAEDFAGNTGTTSVPIHIVSSTPPPTVTISSPGVGNVVSGTITATGTCGDDVAVAMVTLKVDGVVVGFADINGSNWTAQFDTTPFADGSRYLTATVSDYYGNTATATVPVAINNNATTNPIGDIKNAVDGSSIRLGNAVVVADKSLVGDGVYVEDVDRTAGVKLITNTNLTVGDMVSVVGQTATRDSERVVEVQDVARVSTGNSLPAALGMNARQMLMTPDSIGKIARTVGMVTSVDQSSPAKWLMLQDASGINVKCKVADGVSISPSLTMAAVTGVVSCEMSGDGVTPVVLISQSSDIQDLVDSGSISGTVTEGGTQIVNQTVESAHPYSDNYNNTWTITGPAGATRMRVHFTQIELESCCDRLYIKDYSNGTQQTYGSNYTDVWSNWVSGNVIKLNLTTDSSVTKYGFQVDKYEADTGASATPVSGVTLTLSPGGVTKTTAADGTYLFTGLDAGSYTVTPSLSGTTFTPASRTISLAEDEASTGNNFVKN